MFRPLTAVGVFVASVLIFSLVHKTCITERITYISTEHPAITYYNKKYIEYANISSRRFGRHDRFYYVDIYIHTLDTVNDSYKWDFFFFEYLSNTYRRSFVEMHFKACDLILKDKFFGPPLKRALKICPLPAGVLKIQNCSIPVENIPPGFPFAKGRIYANLTYTPIKELVASGYIDMEIKEYTVMKPTGKKQKVL